MRLAKKVRYYGASVELCEKTFVNKGHIRVHVHLWINKADQNGVDVTELTFKKSPAHVNHEALQFFGLRGSRSQAASFAGAFYVAVRKPGTVFRLRNIEPFSGYNCKDYWITTLYTAGKITAATAKKLYIKAVVRCEANLKQLAHVEQARLEMRLAHAELALESSLRRSLREFRRIDEVDAWATQYEPSAVCQSRYRFLVLNGPSCTGKTRFARALCSDPTKVWYCDMTSGVPDLRGFNRLSHELIILDEVDARDAIKLKKMLQCSNDPCVLGVSPTMQFSYSVNTWGVKVVICSNIWTSTLPELCQDDQEWMKANSVLVQVDKQLWV